MADKIPEGWKECKIKNLTKRITSGGTPSTKVKEYYGGEIPWLNTKEIGFNRITDTEVKITESGLNNSSAKWIEPNSVIVAMYGATAGKIAINKIPLTTNQACCNLTIDEKIACYNFVYYYLYNSYDELENLASGAAQQNLNVGIISDFLISLPPLAEQRAIASLLSSLDDKIDLLHRQNKTLEDMAETLFRQWFVEEASEDWEEIQIGNLFDITSGKGLRKGEFLDNGKYPVLGANGFIGKTNNYLYDEKLIYTGRVGTLGNVFIVDDQKVWLSDNTLVIRPHSYFYSVYFVLKYVMLENFDVGSTQPLIRQSDIKRIKFSFPSEIIIKRFELQAQAIYLKIKNNIYQIQTPWIQLASATKLVVER